MDLDETNWPIVGPYKGEPAFVLPVRRVAKARAAFVATALLVVGVGLVRIDRFRIAGVLGVAAGLRPRPGVVP